MTTDFLWYFYYHNFSFTLIIAFVKCYLHMLKYYTSTMADLPADLEVISSFPHQDRFEEWIWAWSSKKYGSLYHVLKFYVEPGDNMLTSQETSDGNRYIVSSRN